MTRKYNVAGIVFEVDSPKGFCPHSFDEQFGEFVDESQAKLDFSLKVHLSKLEQIRVGEIVKKCNEEPPYLWIIQDGKGDYDFGFSMDNVVLDGLLSESELYVNIDSPLSSQECAVNNALMLLYSRYGAPKSRLLIHSSVVEKHGTAYSFLGTSGTGKSTHSRLWLKNIDGSTLLNDDNPIVYLEDSKVWISGSPWSGKTKCYKNLQFPLGAIVRLNQAPENKIKSLSGIQAVAAFLPSCSCVRWEKNTSDNVFATVAKVVAEVPVFNLDCLPDAAAAQLCYEIVKR